MKITCSITILFLIINLTGKGDTLDVPVQFSSIQLALDNVDTNDVIMVQPGTYYENLFWPVINGINLISTGDTSNTFIDGGNYGRIITLNDPLGIIDTSTVISGFTIQNGSVIDTLYSGGAGLYIYNCSPKITNLRIRNNKSHNYTSYGIGIFIRKSNLIIRNISISQCELINYNKSYGLGIFCDSSHITINNLTISENDVNSNTECYGAGIYASNSYLDVSDFTFQDNHLNTDRCYGGALNAKNDTIFLYGFLLKNNSLTSETEYGLVQGGGMFLDNSIGQITTGSIINNYSTTSGTWSRCNGGGIYTDDSCNVLIDNIHVNENTINSESEFYSVSGGGIYISDFSEIEIDSSSFSNNVLRSKKGSSGGGISITDNSHVKIDHSNINSNFLGDSTANSLSGGGISISDNSFLTVLNSNISRNESADEASRHSGGGISGSNSHIEVINSIISYNIMGLNGVYFWYHGGGISISEESNLIVTNSTIFGNGKTDSSRIAGSGVYISSSHLLMTNSISINEDNSNITEIFTAGMPVGTRDVSFSNTRHICPGPGNIDENPLFISNVDFRLQVLSPCKNSGNPDTMGLNIPLVDIDGSPRIFEEIIDMGAHENQEQSVFIDFQEHNKVIVFPNPTKGIFHIYSPDICNIQVFNEFGQSIIENINNTDFDLSSFENGIYLIKITTKKKVVTRKLIKQ